MNKQSINIWGRDFDLEVVYDCYDNEQILSVQTEALQRFLENAALLSEVKSEVEKYCLVKNATEIGTEFIENIFKFVMPKSIYVQRTVDNSRVVALMCAYKFDVDNGLAVVFKNERLKEVGTQNIVL
jgi:hypothetical protein